MTHDEGVADAAREPALRIEIFPDDLDETVRFYRGVLGFRVERDERDSDTPYVAMRLGTVRLGAARRPGIDPGPRRPPTGVELVLETADLDGARQRILDAGWVLDEDLTARPWGLRDLRIVDPSGYYWRLTEHAPD
jgi:predicted enzyme related to lactoylglutathione lyase